MSEKKKILLIDDDIELRELYAEIFKAENFEVLQADDGLEGLEIANKELPDIIFTGIIMPRMDGFSMMEELKKTVTTANIPIIISSHMGREEDRKRANELGAKDFIIRGMTPPKEVISRINAVLCGLSKEYKISFSYTELDAPKLAQEFNLNPDFQCPKCGKKIVLGLKLINQSEKVFEAKFMCPECKEAE